MTARRLVTISLLYCGAIMLAQYALIYQFQTDLTSVAHLGTGLAVFSSGIYRTLGDERRPESYGLLTYGLLGLSILLTLIFIGQLSLLY